MLSLPSGGPPPSTRGAAQQPARGASSGYGQPRRTSAHPSNNPGGGGAGSARRGGGNGAGGAKGALKSPRGDGGGRGDGPVFQGPDQAGSSRRLRTNTRTHVDSTNFPLLRAQLCACTLKLPSIDHACGPGLSDLATSACSQ